MTWDQIDERHDQAIVPGGKLIRMLYWVGHDKHYTMCFVPDVVENVISDQAVKFLDKVLPEEPVVKSLKQKLADKKVHNDSKAV